MEIRIRLNEEKEKDKIIIEFLERQYSSNEYIKSLLYNMALSSVNTTNMYNMGEVRTNMETKNKSTDIVISQSGTITESMGIVSEDKEKEMNALVNDMKEFF